MHRGEQCGEASEGFWLTVAAGTSGAVSWALSRGKRQGKEAGEECGISRVSAARTAGAWCPANSPQWTLASRSV